MGLRAGGPATAVGLIDLGEKLLGWHDASHYLGPGGPGQVWNQSSKDDLIEHRHGDFDCFDDGPFGRFGR